jgi:hypothetical protein
MSTRLRDPAVDHINPTVSGPSSPKKRFKAEVKHLDERLPSPRLSLS